MAKDKDYIKLIHTPRWLRLRRDTLTAHPLCERCQAEGYITPAIEVHHRKPVEDGINYTEKYRLMYDPKTYRDGTQRQGSDPTTQRRTGGRGGQKIFW